MTDTPDKQETRHRLPAPAVPSPATLWDRMGLCSRCNEQRLLYEYWNGEWVCGQCRARMTRDDARFGLRW